MAAYPLDQPTLVCFNREHYPQKLQAGQVDYKIRMEAQRKGTGATTSGQCASC